MNRRINMLLMSALLKASLTKTPMTFVTELEQTVLNFYGPTKDAEQPEWF